MAGTQSLRSRSMKMAGSDENGSPMMNDTTTIPPQLSSSSRTRNPPYLPTPTESLALATYPVLLAFGTLFSILSPETRASPYDPVRHAHIQDPLTTPSYFARKDNYFNVLFVKRGWFWITVSFASFVLTHPALAASPTRRVQAFARWALVTGWWVLVTQWCFGPPVIDRSFRFTGGKCEVAAEAIWEGTADNADFATAAACRAVGGRWSGGHDISGHVFLLVLGSFFLLQEVGWVLVRAGRWARWARGEERSVVMPDGAVKGAGVEVIGTADVVNEEVKRDLGLGGKFVAGVVAGCFWMLLMTGIYFHTWFEKFTGLLVAFLAAYSVYILPRFILALRSVVGLPGI
ncbi:inositol phospholipid synthesis and fat-storage-inducing TM-domain-containing protein [Xylariomycetidae sp. FL2044]|nr:inositol phospholipid synthesis and fat-storage-inducing TM-domain-containing protein [Xylariomycetidae sp. FL2044]